MYTFPRKKRVGRCGESRSPKPRELANVLAMPMEGMKCCRTQGKKLKKQNLRKWENKDFRVQSLM